MNKEIYNEIEKIESKNLSNVNLLALVTDTSYEVVFYAEHNSKMCQSNELTESGVISFDFVDQINNEVASIVRSDKKYDSGKMNILKASEEHISVEYEEKNCRTYAIKKEWKLSLDINPLKKNL